LGSATIVNEDSTSGIYPCGYIPVKEYWARWLCGEDRTSRSGFR
jgi:hypothetical protein